jgi:multidrug resistance efflux pump
MNDRLTPIPTPPARLWRQLRLQYLPVVVFAAGLVTATMIWTRWVAPPTLIGEAESVRAEVRSTHAGMITDLKIDLLQPVTAGQIIGHVTGDPKVLEASLAVLRAEIEVLRTTFSPVVDQQRMVYDFDRLQLDWLGKRVELASLQGQLVQAESTLVRVTALHQSKMVPDERFEEAKISRDALAAQVKAATELVQQLEPRARGINKDLPTPTPADGLRAAVKQKEEELRLLEAQLGPAPLVAPIDGIVTLQHRRASEAVVAGDSIVQISANHSDRIVGFLRQPLTLEPKPGMTVEVRTRTFQRQIAHATVAQVGRQFEPISPSLLVAMRLPVSAVPTEFGLRLHITAPAGLALKPGEHVDLTLRE